MPQVSRIDEVTTVLGNYPGGATVNDLMAEIRPPLHVKTLRRYLRQLERQGVIVVLDIPRVTDLPGPNPKLYAMRN